MNKTQIKKLAEKSFRNKDLDEKFVKDAAKRLKRSELKTYLRELYSLENKKTIKVFLPNDDQGNAKMVYQVFRKMYSNKKILIEIDPTLIAGIRIQNNDNIYELSFKSLFSNLLTSIEQKYD